MNENANLLYVLQASQEVQMLTKDHLLEKKAMHEICKAAIAQW